MKILFLQDDFPPNNYGGAAKVAYDLAREMVKMGHEVFVITTVRCRKELSPEIIGGIKIYKIYSDYPEIWRSWLSLYNPRTIPTLREVISALKPDVVYAHNIHYHLSYHSLKIAHDSGARVFLTAHDVMLFNYGKLKDYTTYKVSPLTQLRKYKLYYNPFRNLIIKYYLRFVLKIFPVSFELKKALEQNGLSNCEVIHNGVDTMFWKEESNHKMANNILFGGRISEAKGSYQALLAIKKVIRIIPTACLLIAGDKSRCSSIVDMAKKIGIEKHIKLLGWLNERQMKQAYNSSSLLITPSICFETFIVMNAEAMACGKPVITTYLGAGPEVVVDKQTGYVINPRDTDVFAARIISILKNKKLAREMGRKGRARVEKYFTLRSQAEKYLSYFPEFFPDK